MRFNKARMYTSKRWQVAAAHESAQGLADRLKVSPLIAQILLNRGISEPDACSNFLSPNLKLLHDPALIPNLTRAAERIARAIRDNEKIVIYGDYDVDGITATSILWHSIKCLGGSATYYIPHRIDEGYGLTAEAITQICEEGAGLIVTVDCGVTAMAPALVCKARGVDLIITDHHVWKDAPAGQSAGAQPAGNGAAEPLLPDCFAVVHPRLNGGTYPNPHLCGAGVAFKLAWGIGTAMSGANRVNPEFRAFLLDATAFAALGTIADVVPLIGENRILAHFGLSGLRASKLTGIKALIQSARLTGQSLDSYHVGFALAPRLNACGRMGHARLAVEMMTHADEAKAIEIATYLEQQNRARQAIEKQILEAAMAQATELHCDRPDVRGIVLGGEGWHQGVIGIVASRIVQKFHKPTIMVALNNGIGQGSGRSISGFHLSKALDACTKNLVSHGGHEMAAGLRLKAENFQAFREAFIAYTAEQVPDELLVPSLSLETEAELRHFTRALVTDLQRLAPFGQGNRRPVLACRNLQLAAPPRRVGKTGDHLQLFVKQGNSSMKAIAFNAGELFDRLTVGKTISLAVEPTINEFNGRSSVELEVKDLQFAD